MEPEMTPFDIHETVASTSTQVADTLANFMWAGAGILGCVIAYMIFKPVLDTALQYFSSIFSGVTK